MNKLREFLNLRELGEYLTDDYAEAFADIFGFISFVSIILFIFWSLRLIPPFSTFFKMIRQDMDKQFSETYLIKELIPNEIIRHRFYRLLMWGLFFSIIMGHLASFYFASAAIAAMLAENLPGNRYTALVILSSLSALLFLSSVYNMKEAPNSDNKCTTHG